MATRDGVHDDDARDPDQPRRLLAIERDALIPLLRSRVGDDFAKPVPACPGWTVRDVVAHCSAGLTRVVEGRFEPGVFTPASNDRDIAERAGWTDGQVVDELERGMTDAGPVIAQSDGWLDSVALAEWVHAGDVRDALGEPGAYGGAGLPDALALLASITQRQGHVPLHADLDDLDEPLRLGETGGERALGHFKGDGPTLLRLYAARSVEGLRYDLAGVEANELHLFG